MYSFEWSEIRIFRKKMYSSCTRSFCCHFHVLCFSFVNFALCKTRFLYDRNYIFSCEYDFKHYSCIQRFYFYFISKEILLCKKYTSFGYRYDYFQMFVYNMKSISRVKLYEKNFSFQNFDNGELKLVLIFQLVFRKNTRIEVVRKYM